MSLDYNNLYYVVNKMLSHRGWNIAVEIKNIYRSKVDHLLWGGLEIIYKPWNNKNYEEVEIIFPFDENNELEYFIWRNFAVDDKRNNV